MKPEPPTESELRRAYARAELARVGITYQRAMEIPHLRTALTDTALAFRRPAKHESEPQPTIMPPARSQCFLSLQFKTQED